MAKVPAQTSRAAARAPSTAKASAERPGQAATDQEAVDEERHSTAKRLLIRGPGSGRTLRSFTLPDADGRPVSLWSYHQRRNLVLFFHHGSTCADCRAVLRDLSASRAAFQDEEAIVLAVGPDPPALAKELATSLNPGFPLLCDPSKQVVAKQNLLMPSLVVADRFGEIWAAWAGGDAHLLPNGAEIARWLEFVELQCPECGPAEWPPLPTDVIMD